MSKSTNIASPTGKYLTTIEFPKTCPHCHQKAIPTLVNKEVMFLSDFCVIAALFFQCIECEHFFVNEYRLDKVGDSFHISLVPYTYTKKIEADVPDRVQQISRKFVEIYEDSLYAESYDLHHLVGIGLRKATEFLLKDYAIYKNPDDADEIKPMYLMQVITKFYSDQKNILTLAKATTWLGNDETHYLKIHTDKDLDDLKMFLKALISFIDNSLIFEEAVSFTARQK